MNQATGICRPELLHFFKDERLCLGADQEWYPQFWQRQAGCGPTNCAQLLWYLSQTRPACAALAEQDCHDADKFVCLMERVWQYVTPGRMGVNRASIFTEGAIHYGDDCGVILQSRVLEIPARPFARPQAGEVAAFLAAAFGNDLPVAFLNLANGVLNNLDSWHWVTLIAYDPQKLTATMYNQGESSEIDLRLWLRTTTLGGALVTLEEAPLPV